MEFERGDHEERRKTGMKYVLIVILMLFAVGCTEKEDENAAINERINSIHNDHIQPLWTKNTELRARLVQLENDYAELRCQLEINQTMYRDVYMDVRERLDALEQDYDPNAPQYAFLEVAEPNWVNAFGDTAETRMLYQISKNRVNAAMIDKRLSALENPVEPNAVAEVKQ